MDINSANIKTYICLKMESLIALYGSVLEESHLLNVLKTEQKTAVNAIAEAELIPIKDKQRSDGNIEKFLINAALEGIYCHIIINLDEQLLWYHVYDANDESVLADGKFTKTL